MTQKSNCNDYTMLPIRGFGLAVDAGAISMPGGCIDYSLEEQWTGCRWVNGKKIYQKTIFLERELTADQLITIPHNVQGMEYGVKIWGVFLHGVSGNFIPLPMVSASLQAENTDIALYFEGKTGITMLSHAATRPATCHITIQYTCTDR